MRPATVEDFWEDLRLTVRELLTRDASASGIRRAVTRALALGPFVEDDEENAA